MRARHSRQARLAEVGEEGQRRIAATTGVVLGHGVAARVEARYLAGAGVAHLVVEDAAAGSSAKDVDALVAIRLSSEEHGDQDPSWALDLTPGAREVALGAHRALRVLRAAILRQDRS